jgi:hypothetical protein
MTKKSKQKNKVTVAQKKNAEKKNPEGKTKK